MIAGYAMVRRAMYQFGSLLPAGPRQHVDCGLGNAIPLWIQALDTWSSPAVPSRCSPRAARRSSRASTGGLPNW